MKKLPAHRAGLPGNDNLIIGSALTPLRESATAFPAEQEGLLMGAYRLPAGRQGRQAGHPADLPVTLLILRMPAPVAVEQGTGKPQLSSKCLCFSKRSIPRELMSMVVVCPSLMYSATS